MQVSAKRSILWVVSNPASIKELRQELRAASVFENHTVATTFKYIFLIGIGVGLWIVALQSPVWLALCIAPVAAIPLASGSMIGHEGAHGSFSSDKTKNEVMLHVAFPLMGGLGALHWKQKHNVLHHGHPNVHGIDDDVALWPMALCEAGYKDSPRPQQFFQKHLQGYLFWPLTLFLSFVMRWETVKGSVRYVRKNGITKALVADVSCLIIHYSLWIGLPAVLFGLSKALIVYTSVWAVGGLLLALIFAPAHIGLPIVSDYEKGWKHQLATTRNLKLPKVISWLFIGLDYQVEHHLFTKIPHQNLPRAQEIMKAWCHREQLPHFEEPYLVALKDTASYFFSAWQAPPSTEGTGSTTEPSKDTPFSGQDVVPKQASVG